MALQSSGSISLSNVAAEFGGTTPHSLSEYYGSDTGVPASGQIKLSQFYGTSAILTSPDVALFTHGQNSDVFYSTEPTNRQYNTITSGKLDMPNIYANYGVTESATNQLNYPSLTRYFGAFDGAMDRLIAYLDNSTYYSGSNPTATDAQKEDFYNHSHVISLWVKPDSFVSADGDTWQMLIGGHNTGLHVSLQQGKPRYRLRGYNSSNQNYVTATSATTIPTTQWTHIACCQTGNGDPGNTIKLEVHVDNVLRAVASTTNSGTVNFGSGDLRNADDFYIGHYTNVFTNAFSYHGAMGQMEWYGSCPASTSSTIGTSNCNAQVATIWNAHKAKFGR